MSNNIGTQFFASFVFGTLLVGCGQSDSDVPPSSKIGNPTTHAETPAEAGQSSESSSAAPAAVSDAVGSQLSTSSTPSDPASAKSPQASPPAASPAESVKGYLVHGKADPLLVVVMSIPAKRFTPDKDEFEELIKGPEITTGGTRARAELPRRPFRVASSRWQHAEGKGVVLQRAVVGDARARHHSIQARTLRSD